MRKPRTDMSDAKSDLNQLVIFAKVVETHSFTAAGQALGLPKSTVSRKIAQLEERLGVRLLHRTTRKLSLSEVGAAFYERCARISSEIVEAEDAVRQMHRDPRGLLRVAAHHELGLDFLADVVSEFLLAYPRVDIDLELTAREVDPIEEGFDLCVRLGPLPTKSAALLAADLGPVQCHIVASPEYVERRGLPQAPSELEEHDLVVLRDPRRGVSLELHGPGGASVALACRPRLVVNNTGMLREAVLAGVGVGVLPAFKCRADLDAGRLRALLHDWTRSETQIHALYPTACHLAAKLRCFLEFLGGRLSPPALVTAARRSA
jgi:DNA-binding transcriptional LysR family regulator